MNKKYVKLIEAALFTYTTPKEPKFKVHILEKRNTYDNREIDAKALGFFKNWDNMRYKKAKRQAETYKPSKEELQKLIQETDEKRNSISKLRRLETAYQPKIGDMWHSLNDLYKSKFHQFKLDTILDQDGEAIYKIKILPTAKELKKGMTFEIGISALKNKKLKATLNHITPKAIEENGIMKFEIEAKVENHPETQLYPGFSAVAEIILDKRDSVMTIKERNLIFKKDSIYVELLDKNNEKGKRLVKTGLSDGLRIEVIEGLSLGDRVKVQTN